MAPQDLILQHPSKPRRLLLLFHGVGSNAHSMVPLGQALAPHVPEAAVVSVQAPQLAGPAAQWFSVQGITEANRPARVEAAMPAFVQAVRRWQQACGVGPEETVLVGFSQGAIMALESSQIDPPPAARVIALSGRFARPPRVAPASVRLHLIHGDADAVMPLRLAADGLAQFQALGGSATLDELPGLSHGIDARVLDAIVRRLQEARPASH